ncbi:MAG: CBS domain-containing protein [Chitinophagaceae bacterium]|nr:CBS domain-containing protein [Chitinophagaceae bacterium]MBK8309989.1 CBS domain-containing protein [Chitinophagaceae bacterium]MBK8607211.1 CBS domain-containing protein [Chitinophagaceae bacterium]MBP6477484.1 CBS domain-containing protein [Chitinophagaceae bacterium]MBP7108141.1 CBS domain-containing protein [Chitinophagaceae bacterium]
MAKVKDITQAKGNQIYSITPDATVYSALEQLFEKNISALLVMEGEKPLGIFTERDYARKVVLKGKSSKETLIKEIMTSELITVEEDCSIEDAMRIMTNKHIRHLPVMAENKLAGIISIGDVVKQLLQEQQFIINNMENYIKGA